MTILQVTDLKTNDYLVALDRSKQIQIQGGNEIADAFDEIGRENITISYYDFGDTFVFNITNDESAFQFNSAQEG